MSMMGKDKSFHHRERKVLFLVLMRECHPGKTQPMLIKRAPQWKAYWGYSSSLWNYGWWWCAWQLEQEKKSKKEVDRVPDQKGAELWEEEKLRPCGLRKEKLYEAHVAAEIRRKKERKHSWKMFGGACSNSWSQTHRGTEGASVLKFSVSLKYSSALPLIFIIRLSRLDCSKGLTNDRKFLIFEFQTGSLWELKVRCKHSDCLLIPRHTQTNTLVIRKTNNSQHFIFCFLRVSHKLKGGIISKGGSFENRSRCKAWANTDGQRGLPIQTASPQIS